MTLFSVQKKIVWWASHSYLGLGLIHTSLEAGKKKIQAGLRTHIPNKRVKDANGVVISAAKILPCERAPCHRYGGEAYLSEALSMDISWEGLVCPLREASEKLDQ